jgi:hypothetical protein
LGLVSLSGTDSCYHLLRYSLGPVLESWKFFQNEILVLPVIEDQEHESAICVEVKRDLQNYYRCLVGVHANGKHQGRPFTLINQWVKVISLEVFGC